MLDLTSSAAEVLSTCHVCVTVVGQRAAMCLQADSTAPALWPQRRLAAIFPSHAVTPLLHPVQTVTPTFFRLVSLLSRLGPLSTLIYRTNIGSRSEVMCSWSMILGPYESLTVSTTGLLNSSSWSWNPCVLFPFFLFTADPFRFCVFGPWSSEFLTVLITGFRNVLATSYKDFLFDYNAVHSGFAYACCSWSMILRRHRHHRQLGSWLSYPVACTLLYPWCLPFRS